jgi:acetyl-CoA carboxylase carboxyltransferase component
MPPMSDDDALPFDVTAHVTGLCTHVHVAPGDTVPAGAPLVTLESMKTEHVVVAPADATVQTVSVAAGDPVDDGDVVLTAVPATGVVDEVAGGEAGPTGRDRPDLAEVLRRRELLSDGARPEAVARRTARGRRTARTNVEDLVDERSFNEYGGLAIAAQRSRRDTEDLIARTPADGLLVGTATIDADVFGTEDAAVAVLAYDASVLAGTQGFQNHRKTDRILGVAADQGLPVVLLAEGGGGRPGDVDAPGVSALDVPTFARFASLSGVVPTVAVVSGYCFAGNAALAGCCDVIVATEDSNLGMAGPAMIEGGGLGVVTPGEIGPIDVQWANGVVDVRVPDEPAAVAAARSLMGLALSARSGRDAPSGPPADQAVLRDAVPLQRTRPYDVRDIVTTLADPGSTLELRGGYGAGIVTTLARVDGRPVGFLANDPHHLGGAIDTDAARSATRFIDLCDRWSLPLVSLCDTPGFMVGPEAEGTGQVRAFGDMFIAAARSRVPWVFVVLRKSYGLGAQAMAGGSLHEPVLGVSWPTGEFGGMGLEGAVRLGFAKELEAIPDADERAAREADLIERAYEHGSALNVATHVEIDDVIDPADTRTRIVQALGAAGRRVRS